MPHNLPVDLIALARDIIKALDPHGTGGRKVTAEEWAQIGKDLGVVLVDVVEVVK
jgi:hypothetical protein